MAVPTYESKFADAKIICSRIYSKAEAKKRQPFVKRLVYIRKFHHAGICSKAQCFRGGQLRPQTRFLWLSIAPGFVKCQLRRTCLISLGVNLNFLSGPGSGVVEKEIRGGVSQHGSA
eukprot:868199-Pelagomonas_calceolata.AAC.1